MNAKKIFIWSVSSAVLSIILCLTYNKVYSTSQYVDFSSFVSIPKIIAACFVGASLLAWGNFLSLKLFKGNGQIIFNLLAGILSFASIIGAISATLPLDIEFPEMFPGLVIPMHFFPILAHLALQPLFDKK